VNTNLPGAPAKSRRFDPGCGGNDGGRAGHWPLQPFVTPSDGATARTSLDDECARDAGGAI